MTEVRVDVQVVKGNPPTDAEDIFERARQAGAQEGHLQVGQQLSS